MYATITTKRDEAECVKCSLCDGHGSFYSSMWGPEDCERCEGLGEYDVSLAGRDERPAHPFARDDRFTPDGWPGWV